MKNISIPNSERTMFDVKILQRVKSESGWKNQALVRDRLGRINWPSGGRFLIEWRESGQWLREAAGDTPTDALEAQKRKGLELQASKTDFTVNKFLANIFRSKKLAWQKYQHKLQIFARYGAPKSDAQEINRYRFIFLCGLHRSGTSPLFRVLREHPQISGFRNTGAPEDEGQHLQNVFLPARFYGGPGRFGFMEEAHLTETSPLVNDANRSKLFDQWSRYWDLGKPYLIEKSPPNLIRTRFLQALFPPSYFVVITRHPVAVSLATRKWVRSSVESLIVHWLYCHDLFVSDRTYLQRVHIIRYEDLIRHPDKVILNVYKFLGLEPHSLQALDPHVNEQYFNQWRRLSADCNGQESIRTIESKYESHLQAHGYTFRDIADAKRL
jgi:hypothetical protein